MTGKSFRLKNAPLIHVLIQVVVDPYLKVGTKIPDLQEGLRPLGFIEYQEAQHQHVNFDVDSGQLQFTNSNSWYFYTKDKTCRLSVNPHAIVLQRTVHSGFKEMKDLLLKVIIETNKVWPGGHQIRHRLGLRYVNLIVPGSGKKRSLDFVQSGLHGIKTAFDDDQLNFRKVETYAHRQRGIVAVRFSDLPEQPVLPPGIDPVGMRQKMPLPGTKFGILDIDRYEQQERTFDAEELSRDLDVFNVDAEQAFLTSCTDEALEEWGIEYVD